jgi:integrase
MEKIELGQLTTRIVNAKSSAGRRVIAMNSTVHSLLTDLATRSTSPLLFTGNRNPGEQLLDLKKGFKKVVQLAAIPHIRFHDLRRTFATRLVIAGVDLITVPQAPRSFPNYNDSPLCSFAR